MNGLRADWPVGTTRSALLTPALTRADIARYAGASGDVNLVHVDEPFAAAAGHHAPLAHGMYTMGVSGGYLASLLGHERIRTFGGRLLRPVHVGDPLRCTVVVLGHEPAGDGIRLEISTTGADDVIVFAGTALAGTTVRDAERARS